MNYRIVTHSPLIGKWVQERANCPYNPEVDIACGVVNDSYPPTSPMFIRGGVVFTQFSGSAIWIHVAGRNETWITRDFLWFTFDYPFRQLGCGHLYGIVEVANEHTLNFDLKLGFRVVATLEGLYPSGNGVVIAMRRDECRFLNLKPRAIRANV